MSHHIKTDIQTYRALRRTIGQNIHTLRLKHKMPLDKLSVKTGFGPHMLDCYEMGKHEISLFCMIKIADALGVHAKDLF